mmetsp:Transcript_52459/g.131942  ORF Transcript_52459/g.131942 Transcript_52459/m.131942 type:complete len:339 (+) Transcript_52459:47-1063(+)
MKITLISSSCCIQSQRIRLGLIYSGVDFDHVVVTSGKRPEWLLNQFPDTGLPLLELEFQKGELEGKGQVKFLLKKLPEMVEFLEEANITMLLPSGKALNGCKSVMERCVLNIDKNIASLLDPNIKKKSAKVTKKKLKIEMEVLMDFLQDDGPFFFGVAVTWADIYLLSIVDWFSLIDKLFNWDLMGSLSELRPWQAKMAQVEKLQLARADPEDMYQYIRSEGDSNFETVVKVKLAEDRGPICLVFLVQLAIRNGMANALRCCRFLLGLSTDLPSTSAHVRRTQMEALTSTWKVVPLSVVVVTCASSVSAAGVAGPRCPRCPSCVLRAAPALVNAFSCK